MLILCGLMSGTALGLTGAGGSLLAVPLLVNVAGLGVNQAVTLSLVTIGITAWIGSVERLRRGEVFAKVALIFAPAGMLTALPAAWLSTRLPSAWLLAGFSVLMAAVAIRMVVDSYRHPERAKYVRGAAGAADSGTMVMCEINSVGDIIFNAPCIRGLILGGMAVGFLSGLFGVGGGFIIVPALLLVTRMDIHHAVATSLLIIALISISGTMAQGLFAPSLNWLEVFTFLAGASAGILASAATARKLTGPWLQRGFAAGILILAAFNILRNTPN